MDDWSKQFDNLLSSPLGKELLRTIKEDLGESIFEDARKAKTQEQGWGLLKEAQGVIRVIEHLQFRASLSKDEGSNKEA